MIAKGLRVVVVSAEGQYTILGIVRDLFGPRTPLDVEMFNREDGSVVKLERAKISSDRILLYVETPP